MKKKGSKKRHKKTKIRANAFAEDMLRVLGNKCRLDWKVGRAEGGTHESVDVVGYRGKTQRVLIEVELRRGAPLGNVVKVWKRLTTEKPHGKLIMFQAFSAFYSQRGTQRGNAEFVGQQMMDVCPVRYIPLSMKYRPGKRRADQPVMLGAGRRTLHAKRLARAIIRRLRKMKL